MQTRICIFMIALLFSAAAIAQVGGGGTIQGTITDPSGAVVIGAEVTAKNVATGVETTRKTTDAGFFVLTPLRFWSLLTLRRTRWGTRRQVEVRFAPS